MVSFIAALDQHRQGLGMSHREFARYIGYRNHASWVNVVNGKWPAGNAFIGRVLTNRPELRKLLDKHHDGRCPACGTPMYVGVVHRCAATGDFYIAENIEAATAV